MPDHDTAYKQLFSHPELVADLLRGYVTEDWVSELDFDTLERISGSFISDDLRERENDILWRLRWGKRWIYLYLLIEFQSTAPPFMAVRLLNYLSLLYQDLIKTKAIKTGDYLPPVLPIVLYNGNRHWTASTRLSELIEPDLPASLNKYQPQLHYLLLDESRYADHELPATRNLAAAVFGLENSQTPDDIINVLACLLQWLDDPGQQSLRDAFVVWLKRVALSQYVPDHEFDHIYELQEMHSMLSETVETWKNQWINTGKLEGRQEGKGEIFLIQLQYKFTIDIPQWIRDQIDQASDEQLNTWSLTLLNAKTLEEIFSDKDIHH